MRIIDQSHFVTAVVVQHTQTAGKASARVTKIGYIADPCIVLIDVIISHCVAVRVKTVRYVAVEIQFSSGGHKCILPDIIQGRIHSPVDMFQLIAVTECAFPDGLNTFPHSYRFQRRRICKCCIANLKQGIIHLEIFNMIEQIILKAVCSEVCQFIRTDLIRQRKRILFASAQVLIFVSRIVDAVIQSRLPCCGSVRNDITNVSAIGTGIRISGFLAYFIMSGYYIITVFYLIAVRNIAVRIVWYGSPCTVPRSCIMRAGLNRDLVRIHRSPYTETRIGNITEHLIIISHKLIRSEINLFHTGAAHKGVIRYPLPFAAIICRCISAAKLLECDIFQPGTVRKNIVAHDGIIVSVLIIQTVFKVIIVCFCRIRRADIIHRHDRESKIFQSSIAGRQCKSSRSERDRTIYRKVYLGKL